MAKKIDGVEAFLIVSWVAVIEIIEFFLTFIFGIGEIPKIFTNIFAWIPIQFWLKMRGVRGDYYLASALVEFIPFVNVLPTKTVLLLITIYLHNRLPIPAKTLIKKSVS